MEALLHFTLETDKIKSICNRNRKVALTFNIYFSIKLNRTNSRKTTNINKLLAYNGKPSRAIQRNGLFSLVPSKAVYDFNFL